MYGYERARWRPLVSENNGEKLVRAAGRPVGRGDAFQKLMRPRLRKSTRLHTGPCIQFNRSLHRVVVLFNKSFSQSDLAHLGFTLAGTAYHVKGVKNGR